MNLGDSFFIVIHFFQPFMYILIYLERAVFKVMVAVIKTYIERSTTSNSSFRNLNFVIMWLLFPITVSCEYK